MIAESIFKSEFDKNSVFLDRNLIMPSYIPDELPFREKQIEEVSRVIAPALKGQRPENLFIYGKVGTGKTSVSKHVMKKFNEFASNNKINAECYYVNCRTHNTVYKVLNKIAKDIYAEESFIGFPSTFIYEKILEYSKQQKHIIFILDEIDKVRDLDELMYNLTRANDELDKGSISVIGISNNVLFKDRLDARTKSSLCEKELVFPPYNAEELIEILKKRAKLAFKEGAISTSAISLAAAYAAKESGDARTAVLLLLKAGEIADRLSLNIVEDEQVKAAKSLVEEEIVLSLISTLPSQQKLVLYAIAKLSLDKKPIKSLIGLEQGVLFSGEIYEEYTRLAKKFKESIVSARWYREYISELEVYGLIITTNSGKGIKGQTRLIKLASDPTKIRDVLEKELFGN
ncbi:MAG: AAA family ATPase [Candidatus Diapherotrites archaeon]|nr:AAA family ATPase [Candidatus Diapherotrites archaeon]